MFDFLKRKKDKQEEGQKQTPTAAETAKPETITETEKPTQTEKQGFFSRLRQGLSKTRSSFAEGVANAVLGKKTIDAELLEILEEQLLIADMGVEVCHCVVEDLATRVSRKQLSNPEALLAALKEELLAILTPCKQPLAITADKKPFVILVVGVNGAGKTTTIGKLAKRLQREGKQVMLAAGDTFRAAAIEQLQIWGERNQVPVIAQQQGADSASVIYDAFEAAKARGYDVLIADTAGRLHTQANLMAELQKVKRVLTKLDASAPHEIMLVLDAGIGQNAISQARQFNEAMKITGITLTKLDGTAKGGIIFAIAKAMCIPIRFIGVGEQIDDLRPFDAREFIKALFDDEII